MAYISTVSTTPSSITVMVSDLDTSWANGTRTIEWYLNGTYKSSSSLANGASSSDTKSFTNLSPSTQYTVKVVIKYSGGTLATLTSYVYTDEPSFAIPGKWYWGQSNGSATASQTQAALDALVGKEPTSNFSYLVWNDLVDKAYEVVSASGDSWDNSYATYASTKMTSSSKVLTASRFNSLRFNVGSHYSTGIAEVSTGDQVKANYFTTIANSINLWIDTL